MKKIIPFILTVMLLTACGSTQQPVQKEEAPRFAEDHVATQAEFEELLSTYYQYEESDENGYPVYVINDLDDKATIAVDTDEEGVITIVTCQVSGDGSSDCFMATEVMSCIFPGRTDYAEQLDSILECGCSPEPREQESGASQTEYATLVYDAKAHSFAIMPNKK